MKKYILPKGFLASGIHCGIKRKRKDLSLLFSTVPCKIAALFTNNVVKAAPVILGQKQLKRAKYIRGVVVNSGNANCMTGKRGIRDAERTALLVGKALGVSKNSILVSSTGVIGRYMPMAPLVKGVKDLVAGLSRETLIDAADGIRTTDRFRKISSRVFSIGSKEITITGIAKGAGMIRPDMATMLCYILTDANISRTALKKALVASSNDSFNSITVDGDMSTNDTVMLLANGEAGNILIGENGKYFDRFRKNLNGLTLDLAKMIVRDGEGATKFVEVHVKGARTASGAKKVAESIGNSLLVKCACLGGDPNWGRIASSAGASGVKFDVDRIKVKLDDILFFNKGKAVKVDAIKKAAVFKGKSVRIEVDLNAGEKEAKVYSCDISKKYIAFNAHYTT